MTHDGSAISGEKTPRDAGAIYDLGYRSYTGARLGRWYAMRSLAVQSLKTAFGIGRTARAKIGPFTLLGLATIPALISTAVAAATGNALQIMNHEQNFERVSWIFALFCAGQSPELVGGDQQYRVLSLYFSRALRRSDYLLAKLAALSAALLIIALGPQLILFFGRAFVNENPWSMIQKDAHLLLPIFTSAVIVAVLFAAFGILIASITKRRMLATAAIIGTLMLTIGIGSTLARLGGSTTQNNFRYTVLVSPILVGDGLTRALFKKPPHPRSPLGRANLPMSVYIGTALGLAGAFGLLAHLRYSRIQT